MSLPKPSKKSPVTESGNEPRSSLSLNVTATNADQEFSFTFNYSAIHTRFGQAFRQLLLYRIFLNFSQRLRALFTVRNNIQTPFNTVAHNDQEILL